MNLLKLAIKNLMHRKLSTLLSMLLLCFGCGLISMVLLAQNLLERQFIKNIEGVDMVVGAKGSPLQLILSAVYQIDAPTGNISLDSFEKLKKNRLVKNAIPLSFGDSYQDFRIVGTNADYLALYNHSVSEQEFLQTGEVLIGASVAAKTGLTVGDSFVGSHGLQNAMEAHDHFEYTVKNILPQKGNVLDKLVISNLESVWAVHGKEGSEGELELEEGESESEREPKLGEGEGEKEPKLGESENDAQEDHSHEHSEGKTHDQNVHESGPDDRHPHEHEEPKEITAALLTFNGAMAQIMLPNYINKNTDMMAALPAYEINRLFGLIANAVVFLQALALVVVLLSGISVFVALYQSLQSRKGELALLRNLGASRFQLFALICLEGIIIALLSSMVALALSRLLILAINTTSTVVISLPPDWFHLLPAEYILAAGALVVSFLASILPALQAFFLNIPKTLSNA